jgi:hypothetical protein
MIKAGSQEPTGQNPEENLEWVKVAFLQGPVILKEDHGTMAHNQVLGYIDYYQVIFREHGTSGRNGIYYIGSAEAGKDPLMVEVLPGKAYDVLFLGGTMVNQVLLVTGYVNAGDAKKGNAQFDPEGQGITIVRGQVNLITIPVTTIDLQSTEGELLEVIADEYPDDELTNFKFTYEDHEENTENGKDAKPITYEFSRDPASKITTFRIDKGFRGDIKVRFSTRKLRDLLHAALPKDGSFGSIPFYIHGSEQYLTLLPQWAKHSFRAIPANSRFDGASIDKLRYSFTFSNKDMAEVREEDIDGLFYFEMPYYAFGTPASGSWRWNIRKGFTYEGNADSQGCSIRLQVGEGSRGDPNTWIEFLY